MACRYNPSPPSAACRGSTPRRESLGVVASAGLPAARVACHPYLRIPRSGVPGPWSYTRLQVVLARGEQENRKQHRQAPVPEPPVEILFYIHIHVLLVIISCFIITTTGRGWPRGRLPFYSSQQSRAGSMPPGEERARLWLIHFFMTASRSFPGGEFHALPGWDRDSGTRGRIMSPAGLAFLAEEGAHPGPRDSSPSAMHIFRISPKALISLAASVTRSPPLAATALINSCLFIAFVFYCSCLILYAGFSCPRV